MYKSRKVEPVKLQQSCKYVLQAVSMIFFEVREYPERQASKMESI